MHIFGSTDRYKSLRSGTLTEAFTGCQHARVLHGGGAHFGDDLCTCVDCGLERYEESFPATSQTVLRKRTVGPKGVYEPVTAAQFDAALPATDREAPLFAAAA